MYSISDVISAAEASKQAMHFDMVKLDTDSADCDLLRVMLDAQRAGRLKFETASLEVWAGEGCMGDAFAELLFDLTLDGYILYRTPAAGSEESVVPDFSRVENLDKYQEITERQVHLPTNTMLELKKLETLEEYKELDTTWRTANQLLISKFSFS